MTLRVRGHHVVTPSGMLVDALITIEDGTIAAVEVGADAAAAAIEGAWIVPGAVDLHVHGGGGASVMASDPDRVREALLFHRRHGTTTSLVSLVSAPLQTLRVQLERLAGWFDDPESGLGDLAVGVHLEGPFLSTVRCGAIDPATMIDASPEAVDLLLDAAGGWLRVITVAPERAGVVDAIGRFRRAGVQVAIGHSDASVEQTRAAIAQGASMATHLGNGMRPFHHRDPGPFGVCLVEAAVTTEIIADGRHLHPDTVRLVAACKGPEAFTVCTDAIAAAGAADGTYPLGSRSITVTDGVARLDGPGSLAGSTTTMAESIANLVRFGVPIEQVVAATSANPSGLVGLEDRGAIVPGRRADLIVMDDAFGCCSVVAAGELVT